MRLRVPPGLALALASIALPTIVLSPIVLSPIVIGATLAGHASAAARAGDGFEATARPVLAERCAGCHGIDAIEGGLDLAALATEADARAAPDVWEAVRDRVLWDEMPPAGAAQPTAEERAALLAWIDGLLGPAEDGPASSAAVDPGPPLLRRLNEREYENTVRDLFGVELGSDALFPRDAGGRGFDTNAEGAALSDALLERLVEAAEDVAARAIVVDDTRAPRTRRFQGDELDAQDSNGPDAALYSNGAAACRATLPRDGRYALRAGAWAQQAGDEVARMALLVDGRRLDVFEVRAERDAPEVLALEADLAGGAHRLEAAFVNDFYRPGSEGEAGGETRLDRNLYVRWIEIEGPLDPPAPSAFQRELFARFGPELGAGRSERVLAHLAELCWRRAPDEAEVGRLVRAADVLGDGASIEERVRLGLAMILASPRFLFRVEPAAGGEDGVAPVDGRSLAVRLSYFLWSSTPDAELVARADDGTLVRDDVLAAQVGRMLADPRARALADGFAAQWLEIEPLATIEFDRTRFPEVTGELRASMRAETLALFRACLAEDRDVRELLTADDTFVDARLAAHYGLDFTVGEPADAYGSGLRRVSLADTPRRGVLSHASVLAATSNPTRTSPVKRGKWVLQALLGQPPPPPPPGADRFDESPTAVASAPLRERLAQHRDDAQCAVCHARMDALGFGLERFGPTGAWRDEADGFPIDASAELPGGVRFDGARELADVLAADAAFPETVLAKLWTYALGRGLLRGDRATLRAILDGLDPERPTLAAMIRGIALSPAFRLRRAR